MNKYFVYKHTSPSAKVYIGITSMTPSKRWKNGKGYELCTAFNRAIQKYGWENIKHEIVFSDLTKAEACAEEQRLIKFYDSANPKYGYNLTSGGEHYEPNDEWRARLSASQKRGYEEHPERRERISQVQIGKKCSEESKKKRSEAMLKYYAEHPERKILCGNSFRGKSRGDEFSKKLQERFSKRIMCVETQKTYSSILEASKDIGVARTAITNMLHGRAKTCKGLTFRFV